MPTSEKPISDKEWRTVSNIPLKGAYSPQDIPESHAEAMHAPPGAAPYMRGAYTEMYRGKPWRIFQLSGFGSPEEEGERIRFLLEHGETGFIMEHDRNTADHMYNVDHPDVIARKEDVGLTGAAIQSIRDYETVLNGIDLAKTYGHPGGGVVQHAPFALGCYWSVAKRRGLDLSTLPGTGQSDFFLTYLGCVTKQQIPTDAGLRFNCDIIEFCAENMKHWVPVSVAGYNGADSGLNAWQELGAVMANAVEYLDEIKRRGNTQVEVAARAVGGMNFRVAMDFFEEIAKLRAARKMWHDLVSRRYGITDPKVKALRLHIVTAGSAMTYQQPLNNIARGTLMGLASVLGGTQSLGVSGYDEALSIPSEHAHQMSLRIQQILQEETNVPAVADPLAGSYFVESLTAQVEEKAWAFFEEIQEQGGFLRALDSGWLHRKASKNQLDFQQRLESGEANLVGVTKYGDDHTPYELDGFRGQSGEWERAHERLRAVRAERDGKCATAALGAVAAACRSDKNIMPAMLDACDAEVTVGEFGEVFRAVYGDWATPI